MPLNNTKDKKLLDRKRRKEGQTRLRKAQFTKDCCKHAKARAKENYNYKPIQKKMKEEMARRPKGN